MQQQVNGEGGREVESLSTTQFERRDSRDLQASIIVLFCFFPPHQLLDRNKDTDCNAYENATHYLQVVFCNHQKRRA